MKIAVCVKAVPDAAGGRRLDPATRPARPRRRPRALGLRPASGRGGAAAARRGAARARSSSSRSGRPRPADALRKTLAMGADRSVLVSDAAFAGADLLDDRRTRSPGRSRARAPTSSSSASSRPTATAPASGRRSPSCSRCRSISQVAELALEPGAGRRPAPDRVRLRADPGAAARRRRRLGRDQRAALPVAEGDHGREVEAAGDASPRPTSAGPAPAADDRARARAAARRAASASGSTTTAAAAEAIVEFLRRAAAPVKTLVFLEHHGGAVTKAVARRRSRRRRARRRGRRRPRRPGRRGRSPPSAGRFGAADGVRRRRRAARGAAAAAARRRAREARRATRASTRCSSPSRCSPPTSPPALAARLDAGLNWDLVDARARRTARSSAAGRRSPTRSGSTSAGSSTPAARRSSAPARSTRSTGGAPAEVRELAVELERALAARRARRGGDAEEPRAAPRSRTPRSIVAGGRGLGGPEGFALVEELAEALGGAVGGDARRRRRRLVPLLGPGRPDREDRLAEALRRGRDLRRDPAQGRDAGVRARSSRSTRTRNAPIFDYADLGVVGDLNEIVPGLAALVRQRRSA